MLSLNRLFYTPYRTPFHTPYRTPYPLLLPCIRLHITIFKSVKFQLILGFACTWFHPIIFTFENSNLSFCAKESAFRFGMSVFFFYYIFLCKNITKDTGRATGARICIFPFAPGNSIPVWDVGFLFLLYFFFAKT